MLDLYTRKNLKISVPENQTEDTTIKFNLNNVSEANDYYNKNGYVIFSKCISN